MTPSSKPCSSYSSVYTVAPLVSSPQVRTLSFVLHLSQSIQAHIEDATPAAQCTHTRDRDQAAAIVLEFLYGAEGLNSTLEWPASCEGPDVMFGYVSLCSWYSSFDTVM